MKKVCTSVHAHRPISRPTKCTYTWARLGFVGLLGLSPKILGLLTSIVLSIVVVRLRHRRRRRPPRSPALAAPLENRLPLDLRLLVQRVDTVHQLPRVGPPAVVGASAALSASEYAAPASCRSLMAYPSAWPPYSVAYSTSRTRHELVGAANEPHVNAPAQVLQRRLGRPPVQQRHSRQRMRLVARRQRAVAKVAEREVRVRRGAAREWRPS